MDSSFGVMPLMLIVSLIVLVVVLLALVVMFMGASNKDKKTPGQPGTPMEDLASLRVTDAQVGDVVTVTGAGDDYDDLSFTVDRKHLYESGGDEWFELSGRYRGQRVFLEIVEDDLVEVSLSHTRTSLSLNDLGLTEDDLIRMDEGQNPDESFQYDGTRWLYESSGEVRFREQARSQPETYYNWDFTEEENSQHRPRFISVEKWEDEPFEVSLAQSINPDDVAVFRS